MNHAAQGGGFLFAKAGDSPVAAPERFSEDQRLMLQTAHQFSREQVLPRAEDIEAKKAGVLRQLLKQAGELGLLGVDIPERYGGLGLDKTTSMLVTEAMGALGSWSVTFAAHTGIGMLPLAWFGTAEQKEKYLPSLVRGERVAAYALTEPGSGSDALAAKTRATRRPDGTGWVLNGSKLYITNAAFADLFVVFAKVDGEHFTAFLVERGTPGLTVGPEEHKMGIRGSSTCPLFFEDAVIPEAAVLGEIGRGHRIAFNILNLGRLKLGLATVGAMKHQLAAALRFAQERKQFGQALIRFGLIREKLATMVALVYGVESMGYRTSGLIDAALRDAPEARLEANTVMALEEFAIEASILKVAGSEALHRLTDEAVQLHGGAGFIEDYPVERAFRDQRINRIFEGTNEINRLLMVGMLLKRAAKGSLPLIPLAQVAQRELSAPTGPMESPSASAEALKRVFAALVGYAHAARGPALEQDQASMAALADLLMDAFAMDAMVARTLAVKPPAEAQWAAVRWWRQEAHTRALARAQQVICATLEGDAQKRCLMEVGLALPFVPDVPQTLRETLVTAAEASQGYPF
ncbi:MAG: acyl-CoA dehydrogenase family protein [Myxococcaceae bacterium]